ANNLLSSQLEDEQWVVKSVGDNVIVNGGGTRGALYATYHFLEDCCDIHWWSEFEEYVPTASSLKLNALEMNGKPAFSYRYIYRGTRYKGGHRFMLRVRQNGGSGEQIEKEFGGCFNYGPPAQCHTFDYYFPAGEYFNEHPEYYSLHRGRRVGGQRTGQLCLTNPELKQAFLEKLFKYIEEGNAKARELGVQMPRIYDISQNDNGHPCECEQCRAFVERHNQSGLYLTFVNAIAEEVEKRYPDVFISTLAYTFTELPPKGGVRARKNVIVKLTNTSSNHAVSHLDEQNSLFRELVGQWRELAAHLFIWEYSVTFTPKLTGMPYASELYYADLYRHYFENNVKGLFVEHEYPSLADMFELKFFLETKLMEDPYQDIKRLSDLFMSKYYGAAARQMQDYRRLLDEAAKKNNAQLRGQRALDSFDFITDDYITESQKLFDDAVKAAGDDDLLVRRLMRARSGLDRLTCMRGASLSYHGPKQNASSTLDVKASLARLEKYWTDWNNRYSDRVSLNSRTMDDIGAFKYASNPLPAPEQFKDRNFYDLPAAFFATGHDRRNVVKVEDNESPIGRAFRVDVKGSKHYDMPFMIGVHSTANTKESVSEIIESIPESAGYNWFKMGRAVKIPEQSFVYVTRAWTVQFPLSGYRVLDGKEFEVWVSAKHVGQQFHKGQQGPEYIFIDRMLLVEPAENVR
ncbi:MAG: DUF4838 domain-containing protein, partial [Victivallales bacterium]|nr:DUF4838 domain-containing protein [Victivallales bacterium]